MPRLRYSSCFTRNATCLGSNEDLLYQKMLAAFRWPTVWHKYFWWQQPFCLETGFGSGDLQHCRGAKIKVIGQIKVVLLCHEAFCTFPQDYFKIQEKQTSHKQNSYMAKSTRSLQSTFKLTIKNVPKIILLRNKSKIKIIN